MPCTSKKFEAQRPEMEVNGLRAVDISLTTRELARMIHDARIDFVRLPDEAYLRRLRRRDGSGTAHGG